MKILALESSTAMASVAVCSDGHCLATESSTSQRTHSEFLNPAIERCLHTAGLQLKDIDVFACGLGPGSFTGLRVAGSIAKTFSQTFQKPLITMDSLSLLMLGALFHDPPSANILCLINAHKNMSYTSFFKQGKVMLGPLALTVPEISAAISMDEGPVLCLGDGYKAYEPLFSNQLRSQLIRKPEILDFPTAITLAKAVFDRHPLTQTMEWNSFEPLYIRASEAEENQRVKPR